MTKQRILTLVMATFLTATGLSSQAHAGVVGFNAGRIIDDSIFTNNTSMDANKIQSFLNSKVPVCDTYGTQMYNSTLTRAQYAATIGQYPPFTCLKDYSENGISAAQIIYNVAQQYYINPQVLIVLLQKEQGLVTDTWPFASQYQKATGYGCPDTGTCNTLYYGFTNQLTRAANMYRSILDASPNWYTPYVLGNNYILYNPNTACGGSVVNIQNRATQALYNYTPYQPNQATLDAGWGTAPCGAYGNRNFYLYFTSWFGVTTGTPLVQAPSSSTVYLLSNGRRFAIPNGDIIYAYGLQTTPITAVSDQFIASVSDGGVLSTLFTLPGDNTVYLADLGRKIGISDGSYCARWGLQCGDPNVQHELGEEFRSSMKDGGVLQAVMKFANRYYLMESGDKLPFVSAQALQENGYSDSMTTQVMNWTNAMREFGIAIPANNSFVKFASSSSVYFYSNETYYGLSSYDSLLGWSGPSNPVAIEYESSYNSTPPTTASTLMPLVKLGDNTISLLTYSRRYVLTGAVNNPQRVTDLSTASSSLLDVLNTRPVQTITSQNAISLPGGAIAKLNGSSLHPIPTMADFNLEFSSSDVVALSSDILDVYSVGKAAIPVGQVIKPGDSAMYIYGSDRNLWALGNLSEFSIVDSWLRAGATRVNYENIDMVGIKVYDDMVSVGNRYYTVSSDGLLHEITGGCIMNSNNVMPLSGLVESRLKYSTTPVLFIRFDNGTIFNVQGDAIHPLASMPTYSSLGGNPSNTVSLPLKALSSFNIGSVTY